MSEKWAVLRDDKLQFAVVHRPASVIPPTVQAGEARGDDADEEDRDPETPGMESWRKGGAVIKISNITPLLITHASGSTVFYSYSVDGSVPEVPLPLVGGVYSATETASTGPNETTVQSLKWIAGQDGSSKTHEVSTMNISHTSTVS